MTRPAPPRVVVARASSDKMRADTEVVASSSSRVVVRVFVPHDHLRRTWMRQSRTGDTAAPVPLDVYGTRRARGDGRGADVVAWRATERPVANWDGDDAIEARMERRKKAGV